MLFSLQERLGKDPQNKVARLFKLVGKQRDGLAHCVLWNPKSRHCTT